MVSSRLHAVVCRFFFDVCSLVVTGSRTTLSLAPESTDYTAAVYQSGVDLQVSSLVTARGERDSQQTLHAVQVSSGGCRLLLYKSKK